MEGKKNDFLRIHILGNTKFVRKDKQRTNYKCTKIYNMFSEIVNKQKNIKDYRFEMLLK